MTVLLSVVKKDHPHAYGDKKLSYRFHKKGVGSSPRVWGQACVRCRRTIPCRIIPTRMGTRSGLQSLRNRRKDHPHAYGDKIFLIYGLTIQRGSSPRVWGQVIINAPRTSPPRIIPTRMGTSTSPPFPVRPSRDHPHAYGDKGFVGEYNGYPIRIIPTRMGTRGDYSAATNTGEDHPHAYGDKLPDTLITATSSGSSPRVWGQEKSVVPDTSSGGIIPTRMGTSITVSRPSRRG